MTQYTLGFHWSRSTWSSSSSSRISGRDDLWVLDDLEIRWDVNVVLRRRRLNRRTCQLRKIHARKVMILSRKRLKNKMPP